MERRDFLRILPVPLVAQLTFDGKVASAAAPMQYGHYLLFLDAVAVNVPDLAWRPMELPENCRINIIPVRLLPGETMDDAVRLYKVEDARS